MIRTAAIIPKLIKPYPLRHLRPHEPRMHNPHRDTLLLQIQTQQFPNHIQRTLARMMSVVPSSLTLMPQRDTAALAADKNDLAPFG